MSREPGVFTIPGFARLWAAYTISGFGAPITLVAVQTLVLLGLAGTAADVGLVTAARWLPCLLFGVIVGALVDRRRRLPIVVATDTALGGGGGRGGRRDVSGVRARAQEHSRRRTALGQRG